MAMALLCNLLFALSPQNAELADYVNSALENNPGLQQKHAEWRAAMATASRADALEDPVLMYRYFVQSDVNNYGVGINQHFPWFGTRKLRRTAAEAKAEALLYQLYAERQTVERDLRKRYYEYAYLAARIQIVQSQLEILRFTADTVRDKYTLGMAQEEDLLKLEIETARMEDRIDGLKAMQPALEAKLNALMNRPVETVVPWPSALPEIDVSPELSTVLKRLRQDNPELLALRLMENMRADEVALVDKRKFPDFTLGLEYMDKTDAPGPMKRDDDVAFFLQLRLPFRQKPIAADREAALQQKRATQLQAASRQATLEAEAQRAWYELEDGARRANLYRDSLLSQAQRTVESTLDAYTTGIASLLDVLDAIRMSLELQLAEAGATRDAQMALADLEWTMGPTKTEQTSDAEMTRHNDQE